MAHPIDLDPKAIQAQFDRRTSPEQHFFAREAELRLFERLELIKLQPTRIIDMGCGIGFGAQALASRFAQAEVIGLDFSARRIDVARQLLEGPSVNAAGQAKSWWQRLGAKASPGNKSLPNLRFEVADISNPRLSPNSVDLIWCNLSWSWLADPRAALAHWYQCLAPGGLLMVSALGVDTIKQWRTLAADLGLPAAMEFADMHDIGDLLVKTGLADPVMDTERLALTYSDPFKLVQELHQMGGDGRLSRKRALTTPRQMTRWQQALLASKDGAGQMTQSAELIFAHAWAASDKIERDAKKALRAQGLAPVEFALKGVKR
jgi:malonyl-CoA O-methyltransferase